MAKFPVVLFISLTCSTPAFAWNFFNSLKVTPQEGNAPVTVKITGPELVLKKAEQCKIEESSGWFGLGGNGLSVDWGDGSQTDLGGGKTQGSCTDAQTTHIYSVPGTYEIKVNAWHPGPTDMPISDWKGNAKVVVTGTAAETNIELLAPSAGETFYYQELPTLKWKLSAGKAVDLKAELTTKDGKVVASGEQKNLAFVGLVTTRLKPIGGTYEALDTALKSGETEFELHLQLRQNGKLLQSKKSGPIKMTAQFNPERKTLRLAPPKGSNPLAVEISSYFTECAAYRINWGDGTPDEEKVNLGPNCPKSFNHLYSKTGQYQITFRSLSSYSQKPRKLDDVVGFSALDIDLQPLEKGAFSVESSLEIRQMREKGCRFEKLELPKNTEILATGAYKGLVMGKQFHDAGFTNQIDVAVNSKSPVALVLGAYDPTIWNIRWTKTTKIVAVLVSGYGKQAVAGLPKETPQLISTYENRGPCGFYYVTPERMPAVNMASSAAFGAPVGTAFAVKEGIVLVGSPLGPQDKFEYSDWKTVDSFLAPEASQPKVLSLEDLVSQGALRIAQEDDFVLLEKEIERERSPKNAPATKMVGFKPNPDSVFRSLGRLKRTFVVLKAFNFPAGLNGANMAVFIVPKGNPAPVGEPSHSVIFNLNNTPICQGPGCSE